MTQARLRTIEEIFYSALELTPGQVGAFLDTACLGDEPLRVEVETLLAAYQPASSFIETPAVILGAKILENTQADLRAGQRIGHYELGRRIGTGGMGEVYLATDILAGRKAALKFLPQRFTGDAERVRRFAQEARAVVALNHPNIVTIYEIGEQDSTHYIASELIDGETLRQQIARGPLGANEALEVAIQVASALHAAHLAGIVHRDIKPENIMLRPDGYVKVLDFGVAKLAPETVPVARGEDERISLVQTHLGAILGTARYMAPEQVLGAPVDKGADIWSLGVVLYEMLTGRAPFTGQTAQEVIDSILTSEPPPLSNHLPDVAGELCPIVERMLRKKKEDRYQDVGELIKALKAVRRTMELSAERDTIREPSPRLVQARWAVSLGLGAIVIALAVAFYWQRGPATHPPLEKSLAVLPLVNTGGDPDNEYFSDGLSGELIAVLAKIPALKVINRSSSFLFKGTSEDSRAIGKKLGVTNLLEGTVHKEGEHIRVVVKLVSATDGREVWTKTYDRELKDVFAVQSEIATAVTGQLKIKLVGLPPQSDAAPFNENLAAYTALQQGDFYANRGNEENARKAIEFYNEAIRIDPYYALAYAGLSGTWLVMGEFYLGGDDVAAAYGKARSAAQTALSLQPNIPDAHISIGNILLFADHNFEQAAAHYRQAETLAPSDVGPKYALMYLFFTEDRLEEAEDMCRKYLALEPLVTGASLSLGRILIARGRYDEAEMTLRKGAELFPKASRWHQWLTNLYLLKSNNAAALKEARLEPAGLYQDYAVSLVQQAQGDRAKADAALQKFIEKHSAQGSFQVASIYAFRKQPDEMFAWLERAYEGNDAGMTQLLTAPFIHDYRNDPRFAALCQKLKLPLPQSAK